MIREADVRSGPPARRLLPRAAPAALAALVLGVAAFGLALAAGQARAALAALAASWLFFAGLAAGSVAFAAAVRLARGRWAGAVLPVAEAGVAFFAPAFILLLVLVVGARAFVPWAAAASPARLGALALRQLAPTAALFVLGSRFVRKTRDGAAGCEAAAVPFLLAYAAALSLWAYDWSMALGDAPPATALPAYFFMGAFLSAIAWVALVAAVRGLGGPDLRHDLGKLLFAFAAVWAYLLWALYLAAWYGGVPAEVAPLVARWRGPYRPIAMGVLAAVFAWPFSLLLPERLKRRRGALAASAGAVLAGLLAERFLLVLPALPLPAGAATLAVAAGVSLGVAALFGLRVGRPLARLWPARGPRTFAPPPPAEQ